MKAILLIFGLIFAISISVGSVSTVAVDLSVDDVFLNPACGDNASFKYLNFSENSSNIIQFAWVRDIVR